MVPVLYIEFVISVTTHSRADPKDSSYFPLNLFKKYDKSENKVKQVHEKDKEVCQSM